MSGLQLYMEYLFYIIAHTEKAFLKQQFCDEQQPLRHNVYWLQFIWASPGILLISMNKSHL